MHPQDKNSFGATYLVVANSKVDWRDPPDIASKPVAEIFYHAVELDPDAHRHTVVLGTRHHLHNAHRNQQAGYGCLLQFDFTHGFITTKHQVGLGTTADVQQHGHITFGVITNVDGADLELIIKIFSEAKEITEAACRVEFGDPTWEWDVRFGMADGADELGDAFKDVWPECTRLMCGPHVRRCLASTGVKKLEDKSLEDDLISDFEFMQKNGVFKFKEYLYTQFKKKWAEELHEKDLMKYFEQEWGNEEERNGRTVRLFSRADALPAIPSDNNIPERQNKKTKDDLGPFAYALATQLIRLGFWFEIDATDHMEKKKGSLTMPFAQVPFHTPEVWREACACLHHDRCVRQG